MLNDTWMFFVGTDSLHRFQFSKIKEHIVEMRPACVRGAAYLDPLGYPTLVQEGEDQVAGVLIRLQGSDLLQHLLDEFYGFSRLIPERSLHLRLQIPVSTENGDTLMADAYVLNPKKWTNKYKYVNSGDWVGALKTLPPLTNRLSDRQREYIVKLGQSTGREIIPIELDLYRQLLSLDLIVDKGRRLALTKLGREVYKYFA